MRTKKQSDEYQIKVTAEVIFTRTIISRSKKEAEAIAKEQADDLTNFEDFNFGSVLNIEVDKE